MKNLSILAVASLIATPTLAGGMNEPEMVAPVAPPPVVAVPSLGGDWTGGYVGARLGFGSSSSDGDVDGNGVVNSIDDALLDDSGAIYGVQAGYLYDFGQYVMGAELNLNATDIEFAGVNNGIDALHTLKLKGGYDAGRTLIYGTLGAAYFDGSIQGVDSNDTGYVVGVGLDYLVRENVTIGAEVNYHGFNDVENTGVDLDLTTVAATVNYKF